MREMIEELKLKYDDIILDTPPVGLVADALELAQYCDATLYIVRQGFTKKGMLSVVNEKHKRGELHNISIILNDFANRVVIPQSGHILRVILRSTIPRISGIPRSRKGVFFIVETVVKSCLNRPDFCVSVELDPLKKGVVLKPIFEL